jgi:hypothetical protein
LTGRFQALDAFIPRNRAILHFSWIRSETGMREKLLNWGHAYDFDTMKYFTDVWQKAPSHWRRMRNLHPIWAETWPALRPTSIPRELITEGDLEDLDDGAQGEEGLLRSA